MASATQKHVVAKVSEIPPGTNKIVDVAGRSIGVYNIRGEFFALRNVCPHQGAELCRGVTKSLVVSNGPGHFAYEREGEIVRCPWHQWEFDIKTGHMVVDPAMRTRSYDVTVEKYDVSLEDGAVVLHL